MHKSLSAQGHDRYATKTIKYTEDGPGAYVIQMTYFQGVGNDPLEDAGFRGRYLLLTNMEMPSRKCTYNVKKFSTMFSSEESDMMFRFFTAIEEARIPFDVIEDGKTYDNHDIREIVEEFA